MDRKKFDYDQIQRDVARHQAAYERYLKATRDIDPAHDISRAEVQVREAATASSEPVKPILD